MLGALKGLIRGAIPLSLYLGTIATCLATIFKRAEWGVFLLVAMIPQPNIWYKLHDFPLGNNFIDALVFSILLGMMVQHKGFARTPNTLYIMLFMTVSYISLWNSSLRFLLPVPLTTANPLLADWKNYAEMIFLYFLILNVVQEEDQQKKILILIAVVMLLLGIRSYRNFEGGDTFNYDKRVGGPFEAVGLGPNHFGAFIIDYCAILLGLFIYEKDRKLRLLYAAACLFGLHPLFFSYSRGVYMAAVATITMFGLLKQRSLLVLVAVLAITWQTLLPPSVVDRITMTEGENGQLEHSAGGRLLLWERALGMFKENPVFGVGYSGYSFSSGGEYLANGEELQSGQDVHSFYLRTLSETGVVGITLFLFLLLKAFFSGWRLWRIGLTPFQQGLGFGFMGCVLAMAVTNAFGDRWSYFTLGSYFWIVWAMVDRSALTAAAPAPAAALQPEPAELDAAKTEEPRYV